MGVAAERSLHIAPHPVGYHVVEYLEADREDCTRHRTPSHTPVRVRSGPDAFCTRLTIANGHVAVYSSHMPDRMSFVRILDTPFSWALVGFVIGLALGVTTVSAWLLAIGFGAFLIYLALHGPAKESNEGWLFAAGPAFMMSWVVGFVVRGLVF